MRFNLILDFFNRYNEAAFFINIKVARIFIFFSQLYNLQ